jgi:hypothetical protein
MKWDFFHRAESKKPRAEMAIYVYTWEIDTQDLATALAHARSNGLPRGSFRAGCVEIQTDLGIYNQAEGNRIDLSTPARAAKVIYKTWEQLDEEATQEQQQTERLAA